MLYLLKSGIYYKIGYTKNIQSLNKRIKAYNTHNPEYEFLGSCEGSRQLEKQLHKQLNLKNNEWSDNEKLTLSLWNKIKSPEFKISQLTRKIEVLTKIINLQEQLLESNKREIKNLTKIIDLLENAN